MEKTGSISREQEANKSQNLPYLMQQGISYVQRFSGDSWTDYNAHDPGVTILEQFCYGLTELGYKTAFPIEDLLVEEADGKIDWGKNSFHSPALVFSSHPVTAIDFRKLLIDTFPEIQNCWLTPSYPQGMEEGMNGVYQIEVLPSLPFQKTLRKKTDAELDFLKKLKDFLTLNRNLGEDFELPILLKPCPILVEGSIEVDGHRDVDEIMAEIIFSLEVFLYHPVAFSSLEELQQQGIRLEEIFSGPRLSRGFIQDSELKERSKTLHAETITRIISRISGVRKCWNLGFASGAVEKLFPIPDKCYAAITTDFTSSESIFSTLCLYVNGNLQRLSKSRVSDRLLDLWSKNYRVYEVDLFRENVTGQKFVGRFRNPGRYYSIQHHFPAVYGLGKDSISRHEPMERHAKVRQLKGYLMLMERHLANYLAQLSHISDFFDHNITAEQTYYSQDFETSIGGDELEIKSMLEPGFSKSGINPRTGESRKSWLLRKNRVLDHLLARFGEDISDQPFKLSLKLNLYKSEEDVLAVMLLQKSRILRLLPELNYGKNRAVFLSPADTVFNSALVKLLHLVVGIQEKTNSLIPGFISKSDLTMEASGSETLMTQTSFSEFSGKFRPLHKDEVKSLEPDAHSHSIFSFGKIGIKNMFSRAIDPESYWISRTTRKSGKVEVIFQKSASNWISVWEGNSEEKALSAIATTIQHFRAMNEHAEGMYLVDHIGLRSMLDESEYGFMLLDEWGHPTFRSAWVDGLEERNVLLKAFYEASLNEESYISKENSIELQDGKGRLLAVFNKTASLDKSEVIQRTAELSQLMDGGQNLSGFLSLREIENLRLKGTLHHQGTYRQRAVIFLRKLKNGKVIRENFFDLKASLVLPDWPARFQEKHFRFFLEREVKERCPAHMEIDIHWLNLKEFQDFEQLYSTYQSGSGTGKSQKKSSLAAIKLYDFLFQLKGGENG
ncbi:hypothetical protein [Algoriphagus sp.]|uniref:hypothetical protein n=1 Tax=Algoriphagus sp. TaxID=1872435 RepID=UPI003F7189AF